MSLLTLVYVKSSYLTDKAESPCVSQGHNSFHEGAVEHSYMPDEYLAAKVSNLQASIIMVMKISLFGIVRTAYSIIFKLR